MSEEISGSPEAICHFHPSLHECAAGSEGRREGKILCVEELRWAGPLAMGRCWGGAVVVLKTPLGLRNWHELL